MPVVRIDEIFPPFACISHEDRIVAQEVFGAIYDQFALVCANLNYRFYAAFLRTYIASMRHELAQIHKGHLDAYKEYEDLLADMQGKNWNFEATLPRKQLDFLLRDYRQYLHSSMLRVNSSRYMTIIPEPKMKHFLPNKAFLYKWEAIYVDRSVFNGFGFETPSDLRDEAFPTMYTDPDLIEQVAYNLTENAFKYAMPGTMIRVSCRLSPDGHWYRLTVTNYGYTIPREEFEKLKGFGVRAKTNNSADIRGSGMGLWYCNRVLKRLGGYLDMSMDEISAYDVGGMLLYEKIGDEDRGKVHRVMARKEKEFKAVDFQVCVDKELMLLRGSEYGRDLLPDQLPKYLRDPFTPPDVATNMRRGTSRYVFVANIPHY
jgi:hypothetical protein